MGIRSWWRERREQSAATRLSLAINSDQKAITYQVPDLAGMTEVEGMAYVLRKTKEWNQTCSPEQAATFAQRLIGSHESWEAEGLTMPYWGGLWVLRNHQTELGLDVPAVAPPVEPMD